MGKMKKRIWIRGLLFLIGLAGLFIFMLPFIAKGIKNVGNLTGIVISICLILYAVLFHKMNHRIKECAAKKWGKIFGICVLFFITLILALAIAGTVCIIRAANRKPDGDVVMIVLGCGVNGEKASLMLTERLEAAYSYLTEHPETVCILSGGQGKGEAISEAECMYRYLIEKGIDENRLYKEDMSTSTRENLAYSNEIRKEMGWDENVVIVTNEFHEYRASILAEEQGLKPSAVCGKTAWWLLPTYYVRELYGIVYEWVF